MLTIPLSHYSGLQLITSKLQEAGIHCSGTTSLLISHLHQLFEVHTSNDMYSLYMNNVFLVDEKNPERIASFLLSNQLKGLVNMQQQHSQ